MTTPVTCAKPIVGFVGRSGSGKTTLLKTVIRQLRKEGVRIAVIKHSHHDFEIDIPGKDSFELRKAGAAQMLISSKYRSALIEEHASTQQNSQLPEPTLNDCIEKLDLSIIDLILVEGFKQASFPKIEINRAIREDAFLFPDDVNIIAVATDQPIDGNCNIPILDLNLAENITNYVTTNFLLNTE